MNSSRLGLCATVYLGLVIFFAPAAVAQGIATDKDIQAEIEKFGNFEEGMRAIDRLEATGEAAVGPLMAALNHPNPIVRYQAARTLWRIEPKANRKQVISTLMERLTQERNDHVRAQMVNAIANLWADAAPALGALTRVMQNDPYHGARAWAANGLGQIIPVISEKEGWSDALAEGVAALHQALQHENATVRENAAWALQNIGWRAQGSLEKLQALSRDDHSPGVKKQAATAVSQIRKDVWIKLGPVIALGVLALLLMVLSLTYWLWPLRLLRINDRLAPFTDFKLPDRWGGMAIPIRYLLLVGFFNYRPRVLDAWVKKHIAKARGVLQNDADAFRFTIGPKVQVEDRAASRELTSEDIARVMQAKQLKDRWCLCIVGEVGSGKTYLARQISAWAMAASAKDRLRRHLMLPVMIERDLDPALPEGKRLVETLRGRLQDALGVAEPISADLVRQLLRRQRLLVIFDNVSTMNLATQAQIAPRSAGWEVNAMIAVVRSESSVESDSRIILRTKGFDREEVKEILVHYLAARGKTYLFSDAEINAATARLEKFGTGRREITIMILSLFANHLISSKEGAEKLESEKIKNIPVLILESIDRAIRQTEKDPLKVRQIRDDAKVVAWQCVKSTYAPGAARLVSAVSEIQGESGESRVDRLRDPIGLVFYEHSDTYVRFNQDAYAEYLAAMRVVQLCEGVSDRGEAVALAMWRRVLLDHADALLARKMNISSFLHAASDCVDVFVSDADVKAAVRKELGARIATAA